MIVVYGADGCAGTRRTRRLLRRLGLAHTYANVDRDPAARAGALTITHGRRRTPTIVVGAETLAEPASDTLIHALRRQKAIAADEVVERMRAQNVGDFERMLRIALGLVGWAIAARSPRPVRWPVRLLAGAVAASGVAGWCPYYASTGQTSLGGPGDRPDEAERREWTASL